MADAAVRFAAMGNPVMPIDEWSALREGQVSLLEKAFKKCGWRGPTKPWSERDHLVRDG